jgi:aspartate aminotransferase
MTCGAAASLSCCISALCCKGDEFIALAPYFAEYKVFTEAAGGKFRVAMPDPDTFQIDIKNLRKEICKKTKAVILNSPNNPAGVVYSEKTIKKVCKLLKDRSEKYGHPIYLIADEPYREIVFDKTKVPFLINYYDNTLVCYSYSKSLSLPGERIGYVAVSPKAEDAKGLYAAVMGAGRALGYVCAPSLFQKLVARLPEVTSDISVYKKNRDILLGGLESFGYICVPPQGAFYLFVKALEPDAYAFCEKAKKYELLLVPGDDFGCPGYVRIAYCVSTAQIENSLPAFKKLIEDYKNDRS